MLNYCRTESEFINVLLEWVECNHGELSFSACSYQPIDRGKNG